jgi:hypothetical protein
VFCADEHLVLDAHSEAVKVFGELRIGRDVDTFECGSGRAHQRRCERAQADMIQTYRARW